MTAIIIDDEPLARQVVKEYLTSHPQITILAECGNGFEALKCIQDLHPDLLFLDIQMPKISGFELLELLDEPPLIIFTTAFDEYALKAFDMHAADYLLKPFSKERFDKAIARVSSAEKNPAKSLQEHLPAAAQSQSRIVVKENGRIRIIPVGQVHYLEAADDYTKIHTAEGCFLKKQTMQVFEDSLPASDFVRGHRSYIFHTQHITRIDLMEKETYSVVLTSGVRLPVSKAGYAKLKLVLGI